MPNGQNRYADKARQRSPRSGRTIRIGKNIGSAPVDGRYADVVRELTGLLPLLTYGDWKRLGKWVVALAEEQGITPATDDNKATPNHQLVHSIGEWFESLGFIPVKGKPDWKPRDLNAKQLTPAEQRERKRQSYRRQKQHIDVCKQQLEEFQQSGKEAMPELLQWFQKEVDEWNSLATFKHWDEFWDHYGQCEQSKHGQEVAAMSPAERSEYYRKLYEADLEVSRDLAAD